MSSARPHLAVALLCSVTIAGLLWMVLEAPTKEAPPRVEAAPRLFDQPFRGAPLSAKSTR